MSRKDSYVKTLENSAICWHKEYQKLLKKCEKLEKEIEMLKYIERLNSFDR